MHSAFSPVSVRRISLVAACFLMMTLAACGGKKETAADADLEVSGARLALTFGDVIHGARARTNRASAPMGLFLSLFLADNGIVSAQSAREGVMAQVQFHSKPTEEIQDATFALLEEFGTVLQVDAADLLNRSTNRNQTLNEYMEGLTNITERSRRKEAEFAQYIVRLGEEQKAQQKTASDIEKAIRSALKEQDYSTVGGRQEELNDAQTKLASTKTERSQQQNIQRAYQDMLKIADRRIQAIEENREVMIAGLKVVNVPGAESVGVLEELQRGGRTRNSGILGL